VLESIENCERTSDGSIAKLGLHAGQQEFRRRDLWIEWQLGANQRRFRMDERRMLARHSVFAGTAQALSECLGWSLKRTMVVCRHPPSRARPRGRAALHPV